MAMSTINNSNPPGRGKPLTSTDLNTSFTEVNNAFPLDGDNVRNEGLDQPVFATYPSSGQSGIILKNADADLDSSTYIVPANTATTAPYNGLTTIHSWTKLINLAQNDILRVYWQFDNEVAGFVSGNPITDDTNATAWVVWLEWQIGGTTWSPVPNQSDFVDIQVSPATHGASSLKTYATTFVNHVYIYKKISDVNHSFYIPPARSSYGSWCFKADTSYLITGLRLQARGLVQNFYNSAPVSGPAVNAWELVDSPSATYQMTVNKSYLAFLQMREQ
jgi:hypothetical protein